MTLNEWLNIPLWMWMVMVMIITSGFFLWLLNNIGTMISGNRSYKKTIIAVLAILFVNFGLLWSASGFTSQDKSERIDTLTAELEACQKKEK